MQTLFKYIHFGKSRDTRSISVKTTNISVQPGRSTMDCKFYLCMLFIMLGTIAVQGARLGNKQENPMHEDAKRGFCDGHGKFCTALNDYCPQGTHFCGFDVSGCGFPPMHCCCQN
ncbi:uncharacterized protein LOC144657445 [Oculina patagonica]